MVSNWGQIEASAYPSDPLDMSARVLLNYVFNWFMERVDHDDWERNLKHIFSNNRSLSDIRKERAKRIKPVEKGVAGGLNIPKQDKPTVEEVDIDAMLGKDRFS